MTPHCRQIRLICLLIDGPGTPSKRDAVLAHIQSCPDCAHYERSLRYVHALLRGVENPPVPAEVQRQLRFIAANQVALRRRRVSWLSLMSSWISLKRHGLQKLIRPVGLTLASSVFSAIAVFGLLFPTFSITGQWDFDATISLVTLPDGRVQGPPGETPGVILRGPALACDEIIVELTVDQDGLVSNWNMIRGELTQDVKTLIVYSKFTPAMYFGYPVRSKVRVALHAADRRSLS